MRLWSIGCGLRRVADARRRRVGLGGGTHGGSGAVINFQSMVMFGAWRCRPKRISSWRLEGPADGSLVQTRAEARQARSSWGGAGR